MFFLRLLFFYYIIEHDATQLNKSDKTVVVSCFVAAYGMVGIRQEGMKKALFDLSVITEYKYVSVQGHVDNTKCYCSTSAK